MSNCQILILFNKFYLPSIYTIYKFLDMISAGNLQWGCHLINNDYRWDHERASMAFPRTTSSVQLLLEISISNPTVNYMFKDNNRNTRAWCEICSKLTTWAVECQLGLKLWSWILDEINLVKWQCAIYRPEHIFRKSHLIKLMKSLTDYIYQRVSQVKFHLYIISENSPIISIYHIITNCDSHMRKLFKFKTKRLQNALIRVSKYDQKIPGHINI